MKTRLVMWGTNAKDEKVLIALALRAADNAVDLFVFPFDTTSEEFYNLMLNEWRENHEVSFPEGYTHIVRPLTASDSLLPDDLRVERGDVIQRAQTEWHFVVLSYKLYDTFRQDLEAVREKINSAKQYSNHYWEEMKGHWEKVQKHIYDKTLMREHGQQLREMTNDLFTALKDMRKRLDSEADQVSREVANKFHERLEAIEEKIKAGAGLQPLFNDLKQIQQEFTRASLGRGDKNKLWKRIDLAFKAAKERKFGDGKGGGSGTRDHSAPDRLGRRMEGLLSAITKMEQSIKRDEKDMHFQDDRIANTEGQLEAQIRMAKLKMIEERMTSKKEKLAEMLKTKAELEQRIEREKKFQEEQQKQQAMKEQLKEAKEAVKQKIAEEIHQQTDQADEESLRKAAEAIAAQQARKGKKKESVIGVIGETVGESLEDLGDTLGAVTQVVAGKIGEAFQDLKAGTKEAVEKMDEKSEDLAARAKAFAGEAGHDISETAADIREGAEKLSEKVKDFAREAGHDISEKAGEMKEGAEKLGEKMKAFAEQAGHDISEKAGEMKEGAEKLGEKMKAFAEEAGHDISEKAGEMKEGAEKLGEKMKSFVEQAREGMEDKAEDVGEGLSKLGEKMKAFVRDVKEEIDEALEDLAGTDEGKKDSGEEKPSDPA